MMPPDARQGPEGPRSDQAATTRTDLEPQSTAPVIDGATCTIMIPAEVGERRGRTYSPLAVQLLDTERAADRLLEELGAEHCRRLALALLALVQEVTR